MAEPESLLDPAFVRELEALRRRLDIRARSGGSGDRISRRKGGSAEFEEHRPYVPGDDLRRVDWLAYARTGEPVIKTFRAEEDVVLRLLLDASASLDWGDPPKIEAARRLAAAFGYMALAGSQRVQVLTCRDSRGRGEPMGIEQMRSPRRGRAALVALLRELAESQPAGAVSLAKAIDQTVQRSPRPGLLVVLSDFFDGGPVTTALTRARAAGHDVALVQVVTRDEVEPSFEGDFTLEDAETGATVDVTMDASAVEAYVLRFTGLVEELRAWARKHGACYLRAVTDEPMEGVVRRFVNKEVD